MYLNRANLEIAALASTDASRLGLCSVRVEAGRTMATDGHALGIVATPALDPKDYPAVGGLTETDAGFQPCSIPVDTAKALLRAIPKRSHVPVLACAKVDVAASNANGVFRAVTTDLETTTPVEGRKIEASYPDVDQVVPSGKPAHTTAFDASLLGKVLTTAVKMGLRGRTPTVTLAFYGKDGEGPVKITAETEAGQAVTFVVMPVRRLTK